MKLQNVHCKDMPSSLASVFDIEVNCIDRHSQHLLVNTWSLQTQTAGYLLILVGDGYINLPDSRFVVQFLARL